MTKLFLLTLLSFFYCGSRTQTVVKIDTLPYLNIYSFSRGENNTLISAAGYGYEDVGGFKMVRFSPDLSSEVLAVLSSTAVRRAGSGIAADKTGNLYTSYYSLGTVSIGSSTVGGGTHFFKFDALGKLLWVKPLPFCMNTEISSRNGFIYLKGTCGILKLDTAGNLSTTIPDPYDQKYHAVASDGSVYTATSRPLGHICKKDLRRWNTVMERF